MSGNRMKRMLKSVYRHLFEDEELLRYLYYPPEDVSAGQPNPMSETLPDIIVSEDSPINEIEKMWDIRESRVVLSTKTKDLEESQICRIYVYYGKARPIFHNKSTIKQEIVVDIFTHQSYEDEMRLEMISDRLNTLLINERPAGLGKIDYRSGYEIVAPKEYVAYRHIFETVRPKR